MQMWPIIKMGLRAAVWKATPNPPPAGFAIVVLLTGLAIVTTALLECIGAGGPARWNPYGFNSLTASYALTLVLLAFFVRPESRATALSANLVYLIVSQLLIVAYWLLYFAIPDIPKPALWTKVDSEIALFLLQLVWGMGAVFAIFRSADPQGYSNPFARLIGFCVASLVLGYALPHDLIFRPPNFDQRSANLWEFVRAATENSQEEKSRTVADYDEVTRVRRSQPILLEGATASLSPQRPGVTDVYMVGVAGWANQEVFRKELDGALDAVARSIGAQGRIKLINDPDTVAKSPIATLQNFAATIRAVARVMDKEEDILLLFMTSHGGKGGVALQFDRLVYEGLSPEDVAAVFSEEGIKNRIVIVSACYSGVFIKPLADDNSIVLTAADADSTSFGCADDREWTYFGDALFNQSLVPGQDLESAFNAANVLIRQWEERDGLKASNPQAHFGPALKEKLATARRFARGADGQNLTP